MKTILIYLHDWFHNDNKLSITLGSTSGLAKFFIVNINAAPLLRMCEAAVTAVICAVLGMVAKDLYVWSKKRYFPRKP